MGQGLHPYPVRLGGWLRVPGQWLTGKNSSYLCRGLLLRVLSVYVALATIAGPVGRG